jgi:hypothetical protein
MRARLLAACLLALLAVSVAAMVARAGEASPLPSPRVTFSNTGMEALGELRVQVHVAGGQSWRELVDIDEQKLAARVADQLREVPGIALLEDRKDTQTPRLLVVAVGHMIADPEGNTDTAATNLAISLNQPVSVRRPLPSGRPIITSGMTWHRSLLITGLTDSMRTRVDQKLTYLVDQFKSEHARANPSVAARR